MDPVREGRALSRLMAQHYGWVKHALVVRRLVHEIGRLRSQVRQLESELRTQRGSAHAPVSTYIAELKPRDSNR